jgi:hypothetical protein
MASNRKPHVTNAEHVTDPIPVKRYYFEGDGGIRICIPCSSLESAVQILDEMYGQDPSRYKLVKAERIKLTDP